MTMFTVAKAIFIALGIIVPSYQMMFNKEKIGIKRITGIGWALVALGICSGAIVIIEDTATKDENNPILDVSTFDNRFNPVIVKDSVSGYHIYTFIHARTKALAYNIYDECVLVNKFKGHYVLGGGKSISSAFNESIIIDNEYSYRIDRMFDEGLNQPKHDTTFMFLKVKFTNKEGVSQPPLRKIYRFTLMDINKPIYEVDKTVYEELKAFLQKVHYW